MERGGDGAPVQEGFRPLTTGVPPGGGGICVIKKIWFYCLFYFCIFTPIFAVLLVLFLVFLYFLL